MFFDTLNMQFDTIRKTLSYAAENLSVQILQNDNFNRDVHKALDESGIRHRRECPLKAPLMMWFPLALMLYRSLSFANVLKMLLLSVSQ